MVKNRRRKEAVYLALSRSPEATARQNFEGRIGGGLDQLGRRTDDERDVGTLARLKKRPFDYFRMFYKKKIYEDNARKLLRLD